MPGVAQRAGEFAFTAGVSRRAGAASKPAPPPVSGSKRGRSDLSADGAAAPSVGALAVPAAALAGVSMADGGERATLLALRAALARADAAGGVGAAVLAAGAWRGVARRPRAGASLARSPPPLLSRLPRARPQPRA
jgi:hypothetical protein